MSSTTGAVVRRAHTQNALSARHAAYAELLQMTEALIAEYAGQVPAGRVLSCVARCREELLRAGVRAGLVTATEAAARVRLAAINSARPIA